MSANSRPEPRRNHIVAHILVITGKIDVWMPYSFPSPNPGTGSGFLLKQYPGFVFSNHHVAEGALDVQILWPGVSGTHFPAQIAGSCKSRDLAAFKLDSIPPFLQPWDGFELCTEYSQLEDVIACGYQLSNCNLLYTKGNISGLNTDVIFSRWDISEDIPFYYQITNGVNEGSSGGPLLNSKNQCVGIVSGGIPSANQIGLAIPSSVLAAVIDDLVAGCSCVLTRLGCFFQNGYPELYAYYGCPTDNGVYVVKVFSHSSFPGLKIGDIITAVEIRQGGKVTKYIMNSLGKLVHNDQVYPIKQIMQTCKSKDEVFCIVWREHQELALPKDFTAKIPHIREIDTLRETDYNVVAGICISPLTLNHIIDFKESRLKSVRQYLNSDKQVWIVTHIFPGTRASEAKVFVEGDAIDGCNISVPGPDGEPMVIVEANGKKLILFLKQAKAEDSKIMEDYKIAPEDMVLLR